MMDPAENTEGTVVETQVEPANNNDQGQQNDAINPAWNDLLTVIPGQLHPAITPKLREWDQNFQKVQSSFKPYKEFADQGVDPRSIQQALEITRLLESNPRFVYDRMIQQFGNEWGINQPEPQTPSQAQAPDQGQQDTLDFGPPDFSSDPRWQQMEKNQQVVAEFLASQLEAQEQAKANEWLDTELKRLNTTYGQFDERYVLTMAQNPNVTLEQAVQSYQEIVNGARQRPSAPNVLPTNGGIPSNAVDVTALDGKSRRSLVQEMLAKGNS